MSVARLLYFFQASLEGDGGERAKRHARRGGVKPRMNTHLTPDTR